MVCVLIVDFHRAGWHGLATHMHELMLHHAWLVEIVVIVVFVVAMVVYPFIEVSWEVSSH